MSQPPLIEFHNATIWRGRTRVFEKLNLTIEQGDCVALLGPNGSGKTTLLKTLYRELYPVVEEDAWVRVLGRERWNVWELRRHIGIVSHDLQANYPSTTTATDVVLSGFRSSIGVHGILADGIRDEERQQAAATLQSLGVGDLIDTPLSAMSTGQQRRTVLARALVHDPDTLILDEPTAGLDFSASFAYLDTLKLLAERGKSIVIATHHLNEIPPEVTRVVLLKAGQIVADGPKTTVLTSELLSDVYETPIAIQERNDYWLAFPG